MPKVFKGFISYSNRDRRSAVRVKEYLEQLGVETFMAHQDVRVSQRWRHRLLDELQSAGFLVAVLSKHFNASGWAPQEVGIAVSRNILTIPVCVDSALPSGFIDELQGKRLSRHIPPDFLVPAIASKFPRELISVLLSALIDVSTVPRAEFVMTALAPLFQAFSDDDIQLFARACADKPLLLYSKECRRVWYRFKRTHLNRLPGRLLVQVFRNIETTRQRALTSG